MAVDDRAALAREMAALVGTAAQRAVAEAEAADAWHAAHATGWDRIAADGRGEALVERVAGWYDEGRVGGFTVDARQGAAPLVSWTIKAKGR